MNSSGNSHLKSYLDNRAVESDEARARWNKDNPGKPPGYGSKTWASYSHVRYPSESFRLGYDSIEWN